MLEDFFKFNVLKFLKDLRTYLAIFRFFLLTLERHFVKKLNSAQLLDFKSFKINAISQKTKSKRIQTKTIATKITINVKSMDKKIFLYLFLFAILESKPYQKHFFSFITQNDGYVKPMIDKYYTAGHSLMYASNEGYPYLFGLIEGETSFSLSLSQVIYTPKAKFDFIPPIGDHPYAGLLSLTFGIVHRGENVLESLGLRLGVSGKLAFGKEVQNGIHQAIDVGLANGWETQIKNEAIINFYYEQTHRYSFFEDSLIALDLLPNFELALGNANTYAKLDIIFKMGYNIANSFLTQGIIGENGGLQTGRTYEDGFSFFVFFGAGGAYVIRKMAIQGNFFKRISGVKLIPWVGNLQAGVALLSGAFSLNYKVLYLSKEFKEQDQAHLIGSIALSYSF